MIGAGGLGLMIAGASMMGEEKWQGRVEFTYVGNLPQDFSFRNAHYVAPLDGVELADELRSHHGYLTASLNEPGGNHQNEGALCGLPLLYRRSGCFEEYCTGFGLSFDETDFEQRLERYIDQYDQLVPAMKACPHTADRTCANYLSLFNDMVNERERIVGKRKLLRAPSQVLRNLLYL